MATKCKMQGVYCPCHGAQFINGQTLVHFENLFTGVVQNFDSDKQTLEVHIIYPSFAKSEIMKYTVSQLLAEFEMDDFLCQAIRIECPPKPEKG